ncbi:MAG: hypothetical protein AB7N80_00490 [Bdellovibrionales bacterium]
MKKLIGFLAIAFGLNTYAMGVGNTLSCREIHSTDPRVSHLLYNDTTILERVGADDLGDIYIAKNLAGDIKRRTRLKLTETGFIFGRDAFQLVGAGKFEAKLEQTNGSPLYGAFNTTHTILCQ